MTGGRLARLLMHLGAAGCLGWAAACAGRPGAPPEPPAPAVAPDTALPAEARPEPTPPSPPPAAPPAESLAVIRPEGPSPAAERNVRVCAGGDVMLGSNLDSTWAGEAAARLGQPVPYLPDPDALLAPLRPLVADADYVLLNVEGAIGMGPAPRKCRVGSTNCYAFRQQPAAAQALRNVSPASAVVGNVANNHAMDVGEDGRATTLRYLGLAGVHATGSDTLATPVPDQHGDTVAFLGFSTFQSGPDARDTAAVRRHVARAHARYGRVVVTMHMGAEGSAAQRTPNETELFLGEDRGNSVAFARTAAEAGASAVFGAGPHVPRAAEWWNGAFIAYSLGNLVTYGPFNMGEPQRRGALTCVVLAPDGAVVEAALRSTFQTPPGHVQPDPTGRTAILVDSLAQLDFPETGVRFIGEARALKPTR